MTCSNICRIIAKSFDVSYDDDDLHEVKSLAFTDPRGKPSLTLCKVAKEFLVTFSYVGTRREIATEVVVVVEAAKASSTQRIVLKFV